MRSIDYDKLADITGKLCERAERWLSPDIGMMIECAAESEPDPARRALLNGLYDSFIDCGLSGGRLFGDTKSYLVFITAGNELAFDDLELTEAVRRGAGTNAVEVYRTGVAREDLKITVIPAGPDFDNMCFAVRLSGAPGDDEILRHAGSYAKYNIPFIVGVGLADTREGACLASRLALCRPVDRQNAVPDIARLERRIKSFLNGGADSMPALAVMAESVAEGALPAYCAVQITGCIFKRAFENLL